MIAMGPTNYLANDELLAQLKDATFQEQEDKFMFKRSTRR
jgi:hypothetical protein